MNEYAKMSKLKYLFYIMIHPVDGYQEMKYNKKGSVAMATFIVLLWYSSTVVKHQLTDFTFNPYRPDKLNLLMIALSTIVIFATAVICNWCFSTLMDGEGALKDIWTAVSYALLPTIAVNFITTFLSKFMVAEEEVFLQYITVIGIIWSAILAFTALSVIHDFSFIKTFNLILLTFLGMLIVLFLFILVYSLFQQVVMFVRTIYYEIMYRLATY